MLKAFILPFLLLPAFAEMNEFGQFLNKVKLSDNKMCSIYISSCFQLFLEDCSTEELKNTNFYIDGDALEKKRVSSGTLLWLNRISSGDQMLTLKVETLNSDQSISDMSIKLQINNNCIPKEQLLPEFSRDKYGVRSGQVQIINAHTISVPQLYYDGLGPAAKFYIGKGKKPDSNGHVIADENGKFDALPKYEGKDIVLKLPEDKSVFDIDYLSIWCVKFPVYFGYVKIPKQSVLNVPPVFYNRNSLRNRNLNAQQCLRSSVRSENDVCSETTSDTTSDMTSMECKGPNCDDSSCTTAFASTLLCSFGLIILFIMA